MKAMIQPSGSTSLQQRIASDLALADLVFLLVNFHGLEVLLHSVLLALQMLLVAAACRPGTERSTE